MFRLLQLLLLLLPGLDHCIRQRQWRVVRILDVCSQALLRRRQLLLGLQLLAFRQERPRNGCFVLSFLRDPRLGFAVGVRWRILDSKRFFREVCGGFSAIS
ncbi:hypothetical protein JKP88DRAFT_215313 [Tribonema minus]|uniref:Secreted protein n=1 Tax=Tribonema minus TaxID=303371 RepID=A0A835YWM9_9STRA|nr:hypothetical protein JKP88DRAFT_215313 [Tribonema minus]